MPTPNAETQRTQRSQRKDLEDDEFAPSSECQPQMLCRPPSRTIDADNEKMQERRPP